MLCRSLVRLCRATRHWEIDREGHISLRTPSQRHDHHMQSQSRATPIHLLPNGLHAHNQSITRSEHPPKNRQLTCETYRYLTQTLENAPELAIAIATQLYRTVPIQSILPPPTLNQTPSALGSALQRSRYRALYARKQKSSSLSATGRWPGSRPGSL